MYSIEASARWETPRTSRVGRLAIGTWRAIARRCRSLKVLTYGRARAVLIPVLASLLVALMVLVGGAVIGQTAAATAVLPSSPPLDPETGVDIRDGVVANGMVTPWMERMRTPDPSVTP